MLGRLGFSMPALNAVGESAMSASLEAIAINPGSIWVAISVNESYVSTDGGDSWSGPYALPAPASDWKALLWSGSLFVATNAGVSSANKVATSPDGVTWTVRTTTGLGSAVPAGRPFLGLSTGEVILPAQSSYGVFRSTDHGVTWVNAYAYAAPMLLGGTAGIRRYIVRIGAANVIISDNGTSWSATADGGVGSNSKTCSLVHNGILFVFAGSSPYCVFASGPASTFATRSAIPAKDYRAAFSRANSRLYAVSYTGDAVYSDDDGLTWATKDAWLSNASWKWAAYDSVRDVAAIVGVNKLARVAF